MNKYYLLDYLKNNSLIDKAKLDLLKYELDQRIYYYGEHFRNSKEKEIINSEKLKWRLKYFLKDIYIFYLLFKNSKKNDKKIIISNAYFSVNEKLEELGLNVLRPMHSLAAGKQAVGNAKIIKEFIWIDRKMRTNNFNELLSDDFLKKLDIFTNNLTEYYRSIKADALIVPNDISFFEQLNILAFKKLNKPSFIFLHGLPGRYNIDDDNQTDYLIVWSEQIKQNYIKTGFDPEKILVSGHPYYNQLPSQSLRNNFEDVLVISKSLNGAQHRDGVRVVDRGGLIVYLNQIADTLKKIGIQKVRLRVHPSENINWYYRFIDKNFFIEDASPIQDSLQKATLIIGPTSTIFLEAIYYGVNYLAYEPTFNNIDLSGYPLVAPFDDNNSKVMIAKTEEDLQRLLESGAIVDKTVFCDYINTPFSLEGVIDKI